MKHKHCDLIKAWADGAEIQSKGENDREWEEERCPRWYVNTAYRIKPEVKKFRVGSYRSYVKRENTPFVVSTNSDADGWELSEDFVKWLTDWIEYEI